MDDKVHPQIIEQNKKETADESKGERKRTEKDQTTRGAVTSTSKDRKILEPPTNSSGTEQKKGAKKRTYSDISSHQGDIKHKWKAKEAAVLNQSTPTEWVPTLLWWRVCPLLLGPQIQMVLTGYLASTVFTTKKMSIWPWCGLPHLTLWCLSLVSPRVGCWRQTLLYSQCCVFGPQHRAWHKKKANKNFGIMCAGTRRSSVKPSPASCQLMALGRFLHPFFLSVVGCIIRGTEVQYVLLSVFWLLTEHCGDTSPGRICLKGRLAPANWAFPSL